MFITHLKNLGLRQREKVIVCSNQLPFAYNDVQGASVAEVKHACLLDYY